MSLNPDLLKLLVCPLGKAPLRLEEGRLVCSECGLKFSINDDIPNMLIDEAEFPAGTSKLADLHCVKSGKAKLELA